MSTLIAINAVVLPVIFGLFAFFLKRIVTGVEKSVEKTEVKAEACHRRLDRISQEFAVLQERENHQYNRLEIQLETVGAELKSLSEKLDYHAQQYSVFLQNYGSALEIVKNEITRPRSTS